MMREYIKKRFYLRGTTPLGLLNTVLAFLFNRVLVIMTNSDDKIVGWFIGKGTDFPRKE